MITSALVPLAVTALAVLFVISGVLRNRSRFERATRSDGTGSIVGAFYHGLGIDVLLRVAFGATVSLVVWLVWFFGWVVF